MEQELKRLNSSVKRDIIFRSTADVIYVDGTACSRKTTILQATGRPFDKLNKSLNCSNIDTYGPSMVGYVYSGLKMQYDRNRMSVPKFVDRSPMNAIEWALLWDLMTVYRKNFGDTSIELVPIAHDANKVEDFDCTMTRGLSAVGFYDLFDFIFCSLRDSDSYGFVRHHFNTVCLIDSDVERVRNLQRKRANGSDVERAEWPYYVPLQNRMYKILYKDCYVDLADFDKDQNYDIQFVTDCMARFLDDMLQELTILDRRNGNFANLDAFVERVPLHVPPIQDYVDHTLANVHTHVYRTLGRLNCKRIRDGDEEDGTTNSEEDEKLRFKRMKLLPEFVDIA